MFTWIPILPTSRKYQNGFPGTKENLQKFLSVFRIVINTCRFSICPTFFADRSGYAYPLQFPPRQTNFSSFNCLSATWLKLSLVAHPSLTFPSDAFAFILFYFNFRPWTLLIANYRQYQGHERVPGNFCGGENGEKFF